MALFSFKRKSTPQTGPNAAAEKATPEALANVPDKLKKSSFGTRLRAAFNVSKSIDEALLEEVETVLLTADVGVAATMEIVDSLRQRTKRAELNDPDALIRSLRRLLKDMLASFSGELTIDVDNSPHVIMVVGVNGAGKTTTIGKLAKQLKAQGKSVMLAAGDTFRAAAVDQLQAWGARNDVPVVAQAQGADSAAVIFDAIESARSRQIDVLIADTAGRLSNKEHLLAELAKVVRVAKKLDDTAPHEVLLVVDGTTGQNALAQARSFKQAVDVSGLAVTKLDGTAKGGIVFALCRELQLPIRMIGVGEGIGDLVPFAPDVFVDAMVPHDYDEVSAN